MHITTPVHLYNYYVYNKYACTAFKKTNKSSSFLGHKHSSLLAGKQVSGMGEPKSLALRGEAIGLKEAGLKISDVA